MMTHAGIPRLAAVFTLFLALVLPLAGAAGDVEGLTYLTEEFRPYNYREDGKAKGVAVELLRAVWKQLDIPEQPLQFLPWPRAYATALNEPNTVLFSTVRSPDREALFRWAGPIAHSRTVLIGRASTEPFTTLASARGATVGVVRGYPSEAIIRRVDSTIRVDVSLTLKNCIDKLDRGRIQYISMEKDAFFNSLPDIGKRGEDYRTVWLLAETISYFAFNKNTPEATVVRFQKALDAVRKAHRSRPLSSRRQSDHP